MKAIHLKAKPFEFISILTWECVQEINQHGILKISGIVSEENAMYYHNMVMNEIWVQAMAVDEKGKEIVLLHGILVSLNINVYRNVYTMSIEAKTGTFLLDQEYHTRSYQDASFTYHHILETCMENADGDFIMFEKTKEMIKDFVLQYKETDWAFANRLGNRLGMPLLPEPKQKGKKFYFGLNPKGDIEKISEESYCLTRKYYSEDKNVQDIGVVYRIRTREIHQLGEFILFQKKKLFIGKIKSHLEGSELCHEYSLFQSIPVLKPGAGFNSITGLSMSGQVIGVKGSKVQISIFEDENKTSCGKKWFDYATVYSSPDGAGWYCMPEIGDEVRLLFPDNEESKAYVASNVHLDTEKGRANPDYKSWKNKQGKEILFTPNCLLLTNNSGLMIELSDEEGIKVHSNKGIFLSSDSSLNMSSQSGSINVQGNESINLQQGTAQIQMKDAINISGGKINMN